MSEIMIVVTLFDIVERSLLRFIMILNELFIYRRS